MTTFKSDQGSFLRFICKWFFMKSNAPLTRNGWLIIPIDKPTMFLFLTLGSSIFNRALKRGNVKDNIEILEIFFHNVSSVICELLSHSLIRNNRCLGQEISSVAGFTEEMFTVNLTMP